MSSVEEIKRIEQIKKRLKNTPKSCLNEKYAEDIKYLLELYENKNKDFMKLQAFHSGDYVRKLNLIEENQKEIEELERYSNSVPKQKIIDKIEELEVEEEKYFNTRIRIKNKINVLQELLGENNGNR